MLYIRCTDKKISKCPIQNYLNFSLRIERGSQVKNWLKTSFLSVSRTRKCALTQLRILGGVPTGTSIRSTNLEVKCLLNFLSWFKTSVSLKVFKNIFAYQTFVFEVKFQFKKGRKNKKVSTKRNKKLYLSTRPRRTRPLFDYNTGTCYTLLRSGKIFEGQHGRNYIIEQKVNGCLF